MSEKINVLVITLKGDVKYQIGNINKSVDDILVDIEKTKGSFYKIIDNCAVRKDEIISVEIVQYDPKKEVEQDDKN